ATAMADPIEKLDVYADAIARTLPAKVQVALQKIGNPARELLALRRYVRKAKGLDAQWVWSDEQIKAYEASPWAVQVNAEIDKVKKKFAELNPGYTLAVSPIRDLKKQISLWNRNNTVHLAAEDLNGKCLREIVDYPDLPDSDATQRFRRFLGHCAVVP